MQCFRTYKFSAKSSESSSLLLKTLQRLKISKASSVLLFSVSTNTPNFENVISYLSNSAAQSIGCLSAPISNCPSSATCSVGYLDLKDCIPFRSTIPGKPPVQVGRWLTRTKNSFGSQGFDNRLPDFSKDVSQWTNVNETGVLPKALADARDLNSVVYFTDNAPEGLVGAFSNLPNIQQLGLFASHTPFITGSPFTLFYNGKRFSSGAVGVAFRDTHETNIASISYPRLLPFSEPMRIHRIDGNLVHVLDDLNPSELLLEAIAVKPTLLAGKNDSLYLGHPLSSLALSERPIPRVYRIVAGGQSRGALALEADGSFKTGDLVQFYVLQPPTAEYESALSSLSGSINLICTPSDEDSSSTDECLPFGAIKILENLTIASENGFLVSENANSLPFRCTVPGSVVHAILNTRNVVNV